MSDKPNILVIMGDDIGWFNPSIYHRGMMGYKTPNNALQDAVMVEQTGRSRQIRNAELGR